MLTQPEDLSDAMLATALACGWGLTITSIAYQPLGFGSHHWRATDIKDGRWFVTVDELETKRHTLREPLDAAFDRLRASLAAACDLRGHGHTWVVAPVPTRNDEPLVRVSHRFGVAVYPFVDGRSFTWGEFATPEHRRAVLELVTAIHLAPAGVRQRATVDDFAIAHRDELDAVLRNPDGVADYGPYSRATSALMAEHAAPVRRLLAHYDDLVLDGLAEPSRMVLTHGEPHPGNTMLTSAGWVLIDWDTALVAPPERDLWSLDPGDGAVLGAYAEATGVVARPAMLELYRLRWDLADLAVVISRFGRPHAGTRDDAESWEILRSVITRMAA